jgi:uncharacterized protein
MNFIDAVISNDVEVVRNYLKQGTDPNMCLDGDNVTPLHFAAQHNALEVAKLLILAGAELHAKTTYGNETPLEVAKLHGHWQVVELIEKSTSPAEA